MLRFSSLIFPLLLLGLSGALATATELERLPTRLLDAPVKAPTSSSQADESIFSVPHRKPTLLDVDHDFDGGSRISITALSAA